MNINKLNPGPNEGVQSQKSKLATESAAEVRANSGQDKGAQESGVKEANKSAAPTDQVVLSASGRSIQQIESDIKSMPDVDDVTIDRIRNAIANGEYKVDYQRLAGKMLEFDQLLK